MASSRFKDRVIKQPGGKPTPGLGRDRGGGYVGGGGSRKPSPVGPRQMTKVPGKVSIAGKTPGSMPSTRTNPSKPSAGSGGPRIAAATSSQAAHLRAIQPGNAKRLSGAASSPGTPSKARTQRFGERPGSASDGGSIVRKQPGSGSLGRGQAKGLTRRKRPKAGKPIKSPRSYK